MPLLKRRLLSFSHLLLCVSMCVQVAMTRFYSVITISSYRPLWSVWVKLDQYSVNSSGLSFILASSPVYATVVSKARSMPCPQGWVLSHHRLHLYVTVVGEARSVLLLSLGFVLSSSPVVHTMVVKPDQYSVIKAGFYSVIISSCTPLVGEARSVVIKAGFYPVIISSWTPLWSVKPVANGWPTELNRCQRLMADQLSWITVSG